MDCEDRGGIVSRIDDYPTHSCDETCRQESIWQVKDEFAKLVEEFALQRFGKVITDHLFSRTILDREFAGVDPIGDKVETTIKMFCPFAA